MYPRMDPLNVLMLSIPAALTACGHASVTYTPTLSAAQENGRTILKSASAGYISVALPVTRIIVQPPGSTTANPPTPPAGHAGAGPTPPANGSKTDTTPSSASAISTNVIGTDQKSYMFSFVQVEGGTTFQAKPVNNLLSSNQLGITFLANSRIPTSVSNTFTDETASVIKTVASLATTALSLAGVAALGPGPGAAPPPTCTSAAFSIDLVPTEAGSWTTTSSCFEVTITPSSPETDAHQTDTVPISYFRDAVIGSSTQSSTVWPVPACLDVKLTLIDHTAKEPTVISAADMKVIDPDYVALMPVPQKGKIAMHPICGADFSDSPTNPWQTAFDVMTAFENAFPKPPTKSSGTPAKAGAPAKAGGQ